jgi:hypothetical protein
VEPMIDSGNCCIFICPVVQSDHLASLGPDEDIEQWPQLLLGLICFPKGQSEMEIAGNASGSA